MNPKSSSYIADMLRAHALRARTHGELWPGLADDLDAAAVAFDGGVKEYRMRIESDQSLWRLSPADARALVEDRMLRDATATLAKTIVLDARMTTYTRYLADGTVAPPEAAGKRIASHHIATAFLVAPIPPTGEPQK